MTLRASITRPEEDAAPLAAALIQRGIETSIESLLSIRTLPEAEIDLIGRAGAAVHQRQWRARLRRTGRRKGTRRLARVAGASRSATPPRAPRRAAGFTQVESAAGNVESLAELAAERNSIRKKGPLFHAAGSAVAGDLAGMLERARLRASPEHDL